MGSALVMMTVPEELIGFSTLHYRDENGNEMSLDATSHKKRERAFRKHPEAYWMLRVPYSAVWQPPAEPWEKYGHDWHWTAALLTAHRREVRRSLEAFMNGKLAQLDRMVRTGWWILKEARVRISSLKEIPHAKGEYELTREKPKPKRE
jgi:hypothetical protein